MAKNSAVVDDDFDDDEEMQDAPLWAKRLYKELKGGSNGKGKKTQDDDDGDDEQTERKPKPNRKHWLLG